MEHHKKVVEYCSEDVSPAGSGRGRQGGVVHHHHVVKETTFEELDKVSRPGGHGHHHGHVEVRETTVDEDINTRTGLVHRRETTVVATDDDDD